MRDAIDAAPAPAARVARPRRGRRCRSRALARPGRELIAQLEAIEVDARRQAEGRHRREDRHDRDRRGVTLAPAAITFGALTVEVDETPVASQPEPVRPQGRPRCCRADRRQGQRGRPPARAACRAPPPSATSPPRSPRSAPSRATWSRSSARSSAAGALRAEIRWRCESRLTPTPQQAAIAQRGDTPAAAKQLEAFFLRQLLAEARTAGGGMLDGGFAGDTFKQMLDEAIADKMAAAGGLGMADMFEKQLGRTVRRRRPRPARAWCRRRRGRPATPRPRAPAPPSAPSGAPHPRTPSTPTRRPATTCCRCGRCPGATPPPSARAALRRRAGQRRPGGRSDECRGRAG